MKKLFTQAQEEALLTHLFEVLMRSENPTTIYSALEENEKRSEG
jgi:hypothetical protein